MMQKPSLAKWVWQRQWRISICSAELFLIVNTFEHAWFILFRTWLLSVRGWWRWALVSPDGVAPSQMVGVSASVNLLLHNRVQKFSSGAGSPRWSRKEGRKTVVVAECRRWCWCSCGGVRDGISSDNLCLCLPTRTSHFLWVGSYTEVVCVVETWPVKNENELTPQRAETRMITWMCGVKVTDRFTRSQLRQTRNR